MTALTVTEEANLKSVEERTSTSVTSVVGVEKFPEEQRDIFYRIAELFSTLQSTIGQQLVPCTINTSVKQERSQTTLSLTWNPTEGLTRWSFTSQSFDSGVPNQSSSKAAPFSNPPQNIPTPPVLESPHSSGEPNDWIGV